MTSVFTVNPAAEATLVIASQPPSNTTAGSAFGLTVDVEDAFGNIVTGYSGSVNLSVAGGPATMTLQGNVETTASGGVASFSGLSIDLVGAGYTLSASAAGLSVVQSRTIVVTPATASQLVVSSEPPTSVTAGSGFGLAVAVEDAYGNLATGYGGEVTIGLVAGPAGAVLGGSVNVAASGGVAAFSGLSIDQAGVGYSIQARASGLSAANTSGLSVTPAAPRNWSSARSRRRA